MSLVKCGNCGTEGQPGQLVCEKCGSLLFNSSVSTVHMRVDPTLLRLRRSRQSSNNESVPEHTVVLQIRGMVERLSFEDGTEVILGRSDLSAPGGSRLDLSRYGAHDRGVSREHALLRFTNGDLTVTDLGSVNGTAVNLTKLLPNQPEILKSGDELMLGTLSIVLNFELPAASKPLLPTIKETDETVPISRKSLVSALFSEKRIDQPDMVSDASDVARETIDKTEGQSNGGSSAGMLPDGIVGQQPTGNANPPTNIQSDSPSNGDNQAKPSESPRENKL